MIKKIIISIFFIGLIGCGVIKDDGRYQMEVIINDNTSICLQGNTDWTFNYDIFSKSDKDINLDIIDRLNKLKKGDVVLVTIKDKKIYDFKIID